MHEKFQILFILNFCKLQHRKSWKESLVQRSTFACGRWGARKWWLSECVPGAAAQNANFLIVHPAATGAKLVKDSRSQGWRDSFRAIEIPCVSHRVAQSRPKSVINRTHTHTRTLTQVKFRRAGKIHFHGARKVAAPGWLLACLIELPLLLNNLSLSHTGCSSAASLPLHGFYGAVGEKWHQMLRQPVTGPANGASSFSFSLIINFLPAAAGPLKLLYLCWAPFARRPWGWRGNFRHLFALLISSQFTV